MLVISLLHTNILLTVLIMSCGLVKDRILCTRGKCCVEHVANMRESFVKVLVVKVDAKRLFVRYRRKRNDNIKMALQGVGWGHGRKLSVLGQGQVLCACECDKGNSGSIKWRVFLD